MKKNLLLILILVVFYSCKNDTTDTTDATDAGKNVNSSEKESVLGFELLKFDKSEMSKLKDIEGDLLYGYKWKDKAGYNLLIFTRETAFEPWEGEDIEADMGNNFVYLKAYHFAGTEDNYSLIKLVQDGELEGCGNPPFELECDFYEESISITDLDEDGYAEATFMYFVLCTSELIPVPTKLIMLENGEKYTIKGNSYIKFFDTGGEKKVDFANADKKLLDFANKTWEKFCMTKPVE